MSDPASTPAMAVPEPATNPETTGLLPKDEKRTSYYPSRQTINTIYNVARTVNKIYPNDMGDDDMDDDDDDKDEDDDEVDEMREGDEPLSDQSHQAVASASQAAAATGLQALSGPTSVNNARDASAARYKITPEKVEPEHSTAAKGITNTPQDKAQTSQPSTTSQSKVSTPAKASIPTTSAALTPALKVQPTVQAQPAVTKTQAESKVTELSPPTAPTSATATSKTPTTTTLPKADPLAPTAAAPYGYKIVSVKKPDGTITKVKRPLKEGEKAPVPAAKKPAPAKATTSASVQKSATTDGTTALTTNEKVAVTPSSSTPKTVASPKEINATPTASQQPNPPKKVTSTVTELPEVSKKEIKGVQVSEQELEQATPPQHANPANDDQYKGARTLAKVMKFFIWTVAIIFPLFFLALAIVTAVLDHHTLAPKYVPGVNVDPLSQAIKVAASAWPIVFAAVVAQTLKMYAAHRVERGIKLVTLEQLISSHSVGGAIKQPFMLRTFNWTTLILFLVWCLSPLAGQAILRMLGIVSNSNTVSTEISYFCSATIDNTRRQYPPYQYDPFNLDGVIKPYYEAGVLLSLVQGYSQTENLPQDVYRNVRVPIVPGTGVASTSYNDSHLANKAVYSSLLGLPYYINDTGYSEQVTQTAMISQYFKFNCSTPITIDADGEVFQAHNLSYVPGRTMTVTAQNNTKAGYREYLPGNGTNVIPYMEPGPSGNLYFTSLYPLLSNIGENATGSVVSFSTCQYEAVMVNTTISCSGVQGQSYCAAIESHEVPALASTALSLGWSFPSIVQNLGVVTGDYDFSPLEAFITNPYYIAHGNNSDEYAGTYGIANVTGAQLSERLGLCLNAIWNLDWNGYAFLGPDQATWNQLIVPKNISATRTEAPYHEYLVYWPWLGVLIGCSVVLLVAAIAAAIWESSVVGPDFLGFANTAVKKSVKMPKTMSTMDARDRLHALQECEVLLQDMRPDRDVGRIALGVKEEGSTRLIQGRRYK